MALASGLAIGTTDEGYLDSATFSVKDFRLSGGGLDIGKAVDHVDRSVREWLQQSLGIPSIDIVAYELPAIATANKRYVGVQHSIIAGLLLAAHKLRAERVLSYAANTIKKRAAGYGKAEKPAMIEAARKWTGVDFSSHDEADAVCILKVALADLTAPKQAEAF